MKEVALSWTLIHKQACVGSYMSFVSLSTEKKGPEETASCHLGTHRLVTCGPKMEKEKIEKTLADPNTRFY